MTETDNPEVKKHIEPVRVNTDEFLATITQLDDNERTNRKMYVERSIKPGIVTATFDPRTNKYQLGSVYIPLTASTVSAALNTPSVTLTCPAGHAYKVLWAGGDNNTTAGTWRVIYTPSGGTATQLFDSATQVCAVNITAQLIGSSAGFTAAATVNLGGPAGPIWMRSGDTLNIENTNDVAGDTITIAFLYEDYTVG